MAITMVHVDCGIVTRGGAATATNAHWDSQSTGTVTTDSTVIFGSTRASVFAAAVGGTFLGRTPAASQTFLYALWTGQVSTATPSSKAFLLRLRGASGQAIGLKLNTTGVFRMEHDGTGTGVDGPSVTANTNYAVEMEADFVGTTWRIKWRTSTDLINWAEQTDMTVGGQAASSCSNVMWGIFDIPTSGLTVKCGPLVIGESTAQGTDYPPRGRKYSFARSRLTSDGTHSFTAGDFGYDTAGADVGTTDTTVWQRIDDDDQTSILDGVLIRQKVIRSTGYIECHFADAPTADKPLAVGITSTHHSASTGANTMSLRVYDGTTELAIWTLLTTNVATAIFLHKTIATDPSAKVWTNLAFNNTRVRWGFSTDVIDIPYLDSVSAEVFYVDDRVPYFTPMPPLIAQ